MAGYWMCDEDGNQVNLMYDRPFVVRGEREIMSGVPVTETIVAFSTDAEAQAWLLANRVDYSKGPKGHRRLWVENWNEDRAEYTCPSD